MDITLFMHSGKEYDFIRYWCRDNLLYYFHEGDHVVLQGKEIDKVISLLTDMKDAGLSLKFFPSVYDVIKKEDWLIAAEIQFFEKPVDGQYTFTNFVFWEEGLKGYSLSLFTASVDHYMFRYRDDESVYIESWFKEEDIRFEPGVVPF